MRFFIYSSANSAPDKNQGVKMMIIMIHSQVLAFSPTPWRPRQCVLSLNRTRSKLVSAAS